MRIRQLNGAGIGFCRAGLVEDHMRIKHTRTAGISALASVLILALASVLILALASGCADHSSSTASICSVESASAQNLAQSKIQLYQKNFSSSSANPLLESALQAGQEIVLVAKDDCLSKGPLTSMIENPFTGKTPAGIRSYTVKIPQTLTQKELERLAEEDKCVVSVSDAGEESPTQDFADTEIVNTQFLPTDPKVYLQKHLSAIRASEAYNIFYEQKKGITQEVIVAVIDSGVEINHEDIKDHLWMNRGEIPGNQKDDDGNGYVDDVNGYNIASRLASPRPQKTTENDDWQWAHGTKVAGLAAAIAGNGRGVAGVMGTAKIMAINNMGTDKYMSHADTANALRYAADNGAHVINLSQGGFNEASADLKSALRYALSKKVVILAAAGNESTWIDSEYSIAGQANSLLGLLSIGNIAGSTMTKASSSNYSPTYVELGAPGTWSSTTRLYTTDPSTTSSYTSFSGTSAATPVATGGAALAIGLIKSRGYLYTASDIERLILESANKLPSLKSYFQEGASLDLFALAQLIDERYPVREGTTGGSSSTPPEPVPPPGWNDDSSQYCQ